MISQNGNHPSDHHHGLTQQTAGVKSVPVMLAASGGNDQRKENLAITPHHIWAAFCRHWFLAVTLGVIAAVPVGYLAWKYVPTPYRAEAEIVIRANRPRIGFELPEDRENFRVLKSREIHRVKHPDTIKRTLDQVALALEEQETDQTEEPAKESAAEQDSDPSEPQVEAHAEQQDAPHSAKNATRKKARQPQTFSDLVLFQDLPSGMDESQWLREYLSVRDSGEETFTISLEGESPEELALVVNSVVDSYLGELKDETTENSEDRSQEIDEQLQTLKDSIERKQEAIKKIASQIDGSSQSQQDLKRENVLLKMSELQAEIRGIEREIIDLKSQLEGLTRPTDDDTDPSQGETETPSSRPDSELEEELAQAIKFDPRYLRLEARIKQLKRDIKRWKRVHNTENLPEIIEMNQQLQEAEAELAELQATLKKELHREYENSRNESLGFGLDREAEQRKIEAQIQRLEAYRDGLLQELSELEFEEEQTIDLAVDLELLRDALDQDQKYAQSLKDQKSTLLIEQEAKDRIEASYRAETPTQRETRKRNILAAGGGLLTFGMVVVLFTLLELRFKRVSSLKLLEEEFHFPILGTIPRLPVKVLQNRNRTRKSAIYQHTFTEAIDAVRTVLLNLQKKNSMKIVMVSSALGGEGKSTLSSHLAISFAQAGRKTLLIDGDLRRPKVHEVFGIPGFPGFCESLRGETPVDKCICETAIPDLDIMPAGDVDAITLRMLAEPETQEVFRRLREQYDLVLFDSSPLLPVADSLLIMQSIDGVLLSIRKDHSRMSKVASALKKIDLVGGNVLGGIVIGINEAEYGYQASYYGNHVPTRTGAIATG